MTKRIGIPWCAVLFAMSFGVSALSAGGVRAGGASVDPQAAGG